MDEPSHFLGQPSLCRVGPVAILAHARLNSVNLFEGQEREHAEEANDIRIGGFEEVLVELIRRQLCC